MDFQLGQNECEEISAEAGSSSAALLQPRLPHAPSAAAALPLAVPGQGLQQLLLRPRHPLRLLRVQPELPQERRHEEVPQGCVLHFIIIMPDFV